MTNNWAEDHTKVIPAVTGNNEVGYYVAPNDVWATQVGGNHYKKYAIQPTEYNLKNNIPFAEGCVIKYVTRWRDKGGIEDLKKAQHFLDILISEEEKRINGK